MRYPACQSPLVRERRERTSQGYRRHRCPCDKQFNERSASLRNRTQYPSDVIAMAVLWRLRYKLSLQDLAEASFLKKCEDEGRVASVPSRTLAVLSVGLALPFY
jgi:hypothetical protein